MADGEKKLCLLSPYGGPQAVYNWPMWPEKLCSRPDGSIEIIETIRWSFEDLPALREAIREELSDFTIVGDMKSYDSMKSLCEKYNSALQTILTEKGPLRERGRASVGLLKHILTKSYNQAVEDPEKLNEYKSWTPEVYGETSFDFIVQLLDTVTLNPDDVFIDLGSGVGQVVLQVAASAGVRMCIGIEKADVPFRYSQQLDRHFRFWMEWFGKTYCDYKLEKGDFFENRFRKTITNANVIFVNNYAFGPKVDHELKIMFEDLKDGARIFSSKAFSPVHFRITDRSLNDIGSVLNVRELQPAIKGSVSWTDNSVSYYCHTVDRTKLEKYFNSMKQTKKTEQEKVGRRTARSHGSETSTDSSNDSSSSLSPSDSAATGGSSGGGGKEQRSWHLTQRSGSIVNNNNSDSSCSMKMSGSRDSSPVLFFGPTTRRAWKEQTSDPVSSMTTLRLSHSPSQQNKQPGPPSTGKTQPADKESGKGRKQAALKDSLESKERPAASSGNEENEQQPAAPSLTKKQRGRPRKDASCVAAAAKVVKRATKNGAVKVAGVNEPTRRPGRPPKKKTEANVLDMLHEQTLLSIHNRSGKRLSPGPGCVDRKLSHEQDAAGGVPSVIVTDSSDLSSHDKLDQLLSSWKQSMLHFLSYMQLPAFKENLTKQIEVEKAKKERLEKQVDAVEKSVKTLQEKGTTCLKAKLSQLGITATTSDGVLAVSRSLIEQNKMLMEKEMVLQAQVEREETLYHEICKVYDRDLRDKRMDRRLFNEIASTMEKKRRLSVDVEKMESSVSNLEKFSQPAVPSAGTPSPSTSTLSSLGSLSPKRRSPDSRSAGKSSCTATYPRVPHSQPTPSAAPVPNANDQVGSLIVAELNNNCNRTDSVAAKTKEPKPKKEAKKRPSLKRDAKSQSSADRLQPVPLPPASTEPASSAVSAELASTEPRVRTYDLTDAKISIKSPRSSPKCRPGSPNVPIDSTTEIRSSGPPVGNNTNSSDKERLTLTFVINRENNSASVKSPVKDTSAGTSRNGGVDRSPCSISAKNSPKSEPTKRKLSVASTGKKKKHRSSRSSGPDTSSESETKLKIRIGATSSDLLASGTSATHSPAHCEQRASAIASSRRPESSFERLLEIAASEREHNNRLEQERAQQSVQAAASTTVPSCAPVAGNRPSLVTSTTTPAPNFHPATAGVHSDLSAGGKMPSQPPSLAPERLPTTSNHQKDVIFSHLYQQQRESVPMSSLQSMKNLASLTSSLTPVPQQASHLPLLASEQQPAPKRKPGRPPKKSISAESWVTCPVTESGPPSCMQQSLMPQPAHAASALSYTAPCPMPDQFTGSHANDSIDYSLMKGGSRSVTGQSSSVIQSSVNRTAASASPSFSANNYYSHAAAVARTYAGNLPSNQAMGGSSMQNMSHASVIRRHDSSFPQPPPHGSYYGMITQPYPAFPVDFQKELHRINMMQSLSPSPKKLLRPSPLDNICRR